MIHRVIFKATPQFPNRTPIDDLNDYINSGRLNENMIINMISRNEWSSEEILIVYYKE